MTIFIFILSITKVFAAEISTSQGDGSAQASYGTQPAQVTCESTSTDLNVKSETPSSSTEAEQKYVKCTNLRDVSISFYSAECVRSRPSTNFYNGVCTFSCNCTIRYSPPEDCPSAKCPAPFTMPTTSVEVIHKEYNGNACNHLTFNRFTCFGETQAALKKCDTVCQSHVSTSEVLCSGNCAK